MLTRPLPILLALLVAVSAAAFAHTDGSVNGTPKSYCENFAGDSFIHDYVATGGLGTYVMGGYRDGNLNDCNGDGVLLDSDGHSEWAYGGALLLASDAGAPLSGATACYGEGAHHPVNPIVFLFDDAIPSGLIFVVAADTVNLVGPDPITGLDCGDAVDDVSVDCFDSCAVALPVGIDGAYRVYVAIDIYSTGQGSLSASTPTAGHITTS